MNWVYQIVLGGREAVNNRTVLESPIIIPAGQSKAITMEIG